MMLKKSLLNLEGEVEKGVLLIRKILLFPAQEKTTERIYFLALSLLFFKYPSNEGV